LTHPAISPDTFVSLVRKPKFQPGLQTANQPGAPTMIRVTFWTFSKLLNREFVNVEVHQSLADARLRAMALNWTISKVEHI
jgi:hypothetical protein